MMGSDPCVQVLIANMICQKYSPSIYDSIIQMKNLPYLYVTFGLTFG